MVKKDRHRLEMLFLVLGIILVVAACGDDEDASVSDRPVQLVYQDWRTDWFPAMAQEMLAEFHATHPNIKVFYSPDPEYLQDTMLAEMQAGTAPDVFQGCCTYFPIWAQEGFTLDLRPFVEADLSEEPPEDR